MVSTSWHAVKINYCGLVLHRACHNELSTEKIIVNGNLHSSKSEFF